MKQYNCTDIGNAERFHDYYTNNDGELVVRYLLQEKAWIQYSDDGWTRVPDSHILTKPVVRIIPNEPHDEAKSRHDILSWAMSSESTDKQNKMLREAQATMYVDLKDFDADPYLIACHNGIVDLRTKKLIRHSPKYLHLQRANASYYPHSICPKWIAFLNQIFSGDQKLIDYVRLGFGYSTTGLIREHIFFLCHGNGRNGKGRLLDTVQYVLGDYASSSEFDIFLMSKKDQLDARKKEAMIHLKSKRFILSSENRDGTPLNCALMKKLTGGDELEGASLYMQASKFLPTHKLWLRGNHLPAITEGTDAIWSRVRAISFNNKYIGQDDNTHLGDILRSERDGIFTWLVNAAYDYIPNGMPDMPEAVKEKTQAYRDEYDKVSIFIRECIEYKKGGIVRHKVMSDRYEQWCRDNGVSPDLYHFRKNMRERNIEPGRDKQSQLFKDCELLKDTTSDVNAI